MLVGLWLVCGAVGWSLATPGGGSRVLLPAIPGWVSLPVVAGGPRHSWLRSPGGGGVWWGCGWCVVWLVPRHSWRRFLCATPRHSWLGFAAGGGVQFPATPGWGLLAAVVRGVWCVVCGVWCAAVVCWWGCGCGWSLATPGGGSCVLLPATPGWVSLPVAVGGPRHSWLRALGAVPRHSWLGSAGGGGVWWGCGWCVVWLVPRHSWRRFLCATPRHSWLGFAAGGGVRFPATPGRGLLAVVVRGVWCVVCGVWCAAVVCWRGCGWCVVWLVPRHSWRRFLCATPRHSWLGFAAGGGGRSSPLLAEGPGRGSPPLLAGVRWRRCVGWSVPRHSWRRFLRATPRHSWLGFGAGGGVWSPASPGWGPLAAVVCGVWCVVCGVWCVVCGVRRWCAGGVAAGVWCGWFLATPGGGSCVLLPATPGWVSLPVVVGGPRHSWLRVPGAVPRHSWLGSVGGGVWGGRSLATPGGGSCVLLPATPGWVSVPVVVCGPPPLLAGVRWRRWCVVCGVWCVVCGVWCVVCGGGVLVGLRLVCGVVGSSPLPAEVPVCYSPPLLAGFRCRRWWAFLATPGGGSRARFPATPGWVSLSAVVCGVWCVVCGVWRAAEACVVGLWLVCGAVGPSPLLAEVPVCYSPPLLAGFRCRWWRGALRPVVCFAGGGVLFCVCLWCVWVCVVAVPCCVLRVCGVCVFGGVGWWCGVSSLPLGPGVCVCAVWPFVLVWVAWGGGRARCGCRACACVCSRCVVGGVGCVIPWLVLVVGRRHVSKGRRRGPVDA